MSQLPFPTLESIGKAYRVDQLFDFLSAGTFATVYRGVRIESGCGMIAGQDVAIKVMNKKELFTEKACRDVINEVAILRRMQHNNCVRLLDVFQTAHDVCLVLEFIPGKELFSAISTTRSPPELKVKSILRQIFSALDYIHTEKRILHRDLKPENILITEGPGGPEDVHVTLVDFGLAMFFGHTRPRKLRVQQFALVNPIRPMHSSTATLSPFNRSQSIDSVDSSDSHANSPLLTTPCGTLKYAAPETVRGLVNGDQVKTTRGALPKLDTFAIGIVAYILLGGGMPYNTKNKAVLAKEMDEGPKFLGLRWDAVCVQAKDLIQQLLSPDISQRLTANQALSHPWLAVHTQVVKDDDEIPPPEEVGAEAPNVLAAAGDDPPSPEQGRDDIRNAFGAIMEKEVMDGEMPRGPSSLSLPPQFHGVAKAQFLPPPTVSTYFPFFKQ